MIVLLDTGPLGRVTNPRAEARNDECWQWLWRVLNNGIEVRVPEIADYELRRELIRIGSGDALSRLDRLAATVGFIAITTEHMRTAADLWARARQGGTPTADDKSLDGDMILSAQFRVIRQQDLDAVIATENVGHLGLFSEARHWQDIP